MVSLQAKRLPHRQTSAHEFQNVSNTAGRGVIGTPPFDQSRGVGVYRGLKLIPLSSKVAMPSLSQMTSCTGERDTVTLMRLVNNVASSLVVASIRHEACVS
ncbi:hypothetical protein LIA77_08072 [Sarocladium implicatum]|nr:hypothetical protein LIA77_08072 [Sarocladium implicatum]